MKVELEKIKGDWKEVLDKARITVGKEDLEIREKDKQIDLMAEFMFKNIDIEEDICNSAYVECKQETSQDITCINCIKQYFEKLAKEMEENKDENVLQDKKTR